MGTAAIIQAVLVFVQWAIGEEPLVADSLRKVLSKAEPTAADWEAEHAAVAAMNYDKIVTNSQIPPEQAP